MRSLLALTLLLAAGCGARTSLSVGADGGAPARDGGASDAGSVDAGSRDAGVPPRRDAGTPGVRCVRDADCMEGVCRGSVDDTPNDLAALRLFCGSPEADPSGAPGAACRERASCDRHLCAVAGACVIPCGGDLDCAPSELCREVWVQTSSSTMESLRACTARVAAPTTVRVTGPEPGPELGAMALPDALPDLRPNALVVWRGPLESEPVIERIVSRADGTVVFDAFLLPGPDDPAPSWGIGPVTVREVVTLMHPNGPGSPPSRRGFEVFLSSAISGPSERVVLQREADGTSFDLDLYLVGGNSWVSGDGEVPRELSVAIDEMRALLDPVGLRVGEVRVHDVIGGLRRRFQVLTGMEGLIGVPPDLPALYRLSAGANRPSIHVFFVRMIEGALGIASGIPGPHAMPGTGASGVAIAADLIPPDQLAVVLTHEIGHFMGLFHSSELDGSVNDPFPDTGECRADRDGDGDGFLLPEECDGFGADNVMFWAGSGRELSPQQGDVMRRAFFVE